MNFNNLLSKRKYLPKRDEKGFKAPNNLTHLNEFIVLGIVCGLNNCQKEFSVP